ncbi:hypothetical protein [Aureimonas sp. ME7]|uniref:hypothetical protein n=1 Tax=Aureimonas sp. ME7 TaxID=2744252 RepID=UPI0015F4E1B1|nr:hypothetical protein [Aureimonas sp. ME7]
MKRLAGFARRLLAYSQACLVAGTTFFLLSLVLPDSPAGSADEMVLRFGISLFYVVLAGTPFALIVLFLLHLTGSTGWTPTIVGGAVAGILPILFLAAVLGNPFSLPLLPSLIAGVSGAAGAAAYRAIAPERSVVS